MGYIGREPSVIPITSSDLANDIVSSNAIADDSISEEHIDNTAITGFGALTSLADTDKFLVSDASDSGNLKYVENQYLGGGGAMVLLQSVSTTSTTASVSFNSVFSDTYTNYYFVFWNVLHGINNEPFYLRFKDTSNGVLSASVYDWVHHGANVSGTNVINHGTDESQIQIGRNQSGGGPTAGKGAYHGVIFAPKVTSYSSSDNRPTISWQGGYARSDILHTVQGSAVFDNGTSVGGIQVYGGNGGGPSTYLDRFEGKIYGIVDS